MRLFLLASFIFLIIPLETFSQDWPKESTLKWSLKREKVAEAKLSPNGGYLLLVESTSSFFSMNWGWNELYQGKIEFIESSTGKTVSMFSVCGGRKFGTNSFSFDGRFWAVTCSNGKAELWDITLPKKLLDFSPRKERQIESLRLSPDGTRLLTFENSDTLTKATQNHATLWNAQNGKPISDLYPNLTAGSKSANTFAEFNRDSSMLAVTFYRDVYLWDAEDGSLITKLTEDRFGASSATHESLTYITKFSLDGTKLLSGGSRDATFKIWSTSAGKLLKTLKGHKSRTLGGSFSVDGEFVATSDVSNNVKLWRVETGELVWSAKLKWWAYYLVFSPDRKNLFVGSERDGVAILDVKTGKVVWQKKDRLKIDQDWNFVVGFDKKSKYLRLLEFYK
ncbi:MAG TPA: hypothetical protein PKD24_15020 [Pyrinomonadaceae bacterium]|nr:hypothetical protein [Pyrinomonadaceae bacterium]HMP66775.1 hypothetical protein [Pyrinomonadaceae bacterium]